jgi:hypothetical protein
MPFFSETGLSPSLPSLLPSSLSPSLLPSPPFLPSFLCFLAELGFKLRAYHLNCFKNPILKAPLHSLGRKIRSQGKGVRTEFSWAQWLTSVILAIQEAEISRITV